MIKKLFLFIVLISFLPFQPINANQKDHSTKIEHVKSKIEAIDSISSSAIGDSVRALLKDTIYKAQPNKADHNSFQFQYTTEPGDSDALALAIIIGLPFLFIFLIIMGCLSISYRKRRDKYRLIEKAIENNYPLPEYLFNEVVFPKMPIMEDGVAPETSRKEPILPIKSKNWASLKSGIILTSVGLGLFLFFIPNSFAWPCSIIFFIGVGKLIITYLQNKHSHGMSNQYYNRTNNYSQSRQGTTNDSGICPPPIPNQPINDRDNSKSQDAE